MRGRKEGDCDLVGDGDEVTAGRGEGREEKEIEGGVVRRGEVGV